MKTLAIAIAAVGTATLMSGSALAQSPAQCDAQARQYANAYANPGQGVVGGAVGGGIIGGIAGSLGGKAGEGAVAGAIGGGILGGIANQARWQQLYDQAYWQCMNTPVAQPAHPPAQQCPALVPPQGIDDGYQVGSAAWVYACDQKYKTFDPNTWLFNGFDGCKHYCNL